MLVPIFQNTPLLKETAFYYPLFAGFSEAIDPLIEGRLEPYP